MMAENAQGNYIDKAIAALDAALAGPDPEPIYVPIRRELLRMKGDQDYEPGYGRFLIDSEPKDRALVEQLMGVAYWRSRLLQRRK